MNLTSLFNFNYLKENIKKSKAIILLCMLLLPILNGIILLMHGSTGDNFVASIYDVSGIILFGMYIIPLVLSITLFSFIYKRGSIDFTLSMPINKKQIFLTNTFGGIIIILLMQIINLIITLAISLIYSNMIIDYKMLFDIFLIYSISFLSAASDALPENEYISELLHADLPQNFLWGTSTRPADSLHLSCSSVNTDVQRSFQYIP